jgi:glycerophosphoryl diester phosphodiesterase
MSFENKEKLHRPTLVGGGDGGSFEIQGHRGCRGLMPENTIPAMLKAIDLGVTALEMDVVISKDNKVVVSHEPWFESEITTKPDGSFVPAPDVMKYNLYQMAYDSIVKYDVGMKPHPRFPKQQKIKAVKPLLAALFDSVENYLTKKNLPKVSYNIEIKSLPAGDNRFHPVPSVFVDLVMAVIREKKLEDRVIIQSFDYRPLQLLHEKYPGIAISLLIEDSNESDFEGQLAKLGFIPAFYSPNFTLVDEELVKQCHEKGMKIITWTVNDKKKIKDLRKMGVDGIITDYPDLFK